MGAHNPPEDVLACVESDAIRVNAAHLAMRMNHWLTAQNCWDQPRPDELDGARSDLIEWCRSARDVLEAVGRG